MNHSHELDQIVVTVGDAATRIDQLLEDLDTTQLDDNQMEQLIGQYQRLTRLADAPRRAWNVERLRRERQAMLTQLDAQGIVWGARGYGTDHGFVSDADGVRSLCGMEQLAIVKPRDTTGRWRPCGRCEKIAVKHGLIVGNS